MELFSLQTKHLASFFLYLSISSLFLSSLSFATIPSGAIERTTKQQILASIPPHSTENTQPFLTSPSGKYTAYLLRRETAPAAGGFGNDFCYIQVQDSSSEESMWESECAPVSTANACSLVFTDGGLEVFDGSESVWDGDGEGESFPVRLDLVDDGDMRVIDKEGELFWRASDDPRANQGCGLPGSPGLAPESPPFSQPIGTNDNLPFGQQQQQPKPNGVVGQQQQPAGAPQEEDKSPQPVEAPPQNEEQQPEEPPVGAPQEEEKPPQPVEPPPQNEEQKPEEPPVGAPQEEEQSQPVEPPPQNEEQRPEEPPVGAPREEEKTQPVKAPPQNEEQQPEGAPQQQPAGAPQPNGMFGMQQTSYLPLFQLYANQL
ncbi:activating signal cointegrator 1 complex subunit 2 [Cocos nucifera]|uniref:Activating signal cointegrator 1 complex subunit 2 n=1 Tax=Cocos nucifera TaxID=13894 RepID=A0A8K0IL82_COCNU|nr:activating signal cointegrator 1 complex subunit 2 [Cocos nucifera]